MKKALTLALMSGWFATGASHAQVAIHIAGSTAFRANAFRAIRTSFDGGAPTSMNPANATGSTGTITFTGTMSNLFGTQPVTVYALYNGSVQGLADLAANQSLNYMNPTGTSTTAATPDITFSDVDRASTPLFSLSATETHIAVLPFTYCRNYYSPSTVTNISANQLQELWDNGFTELSLLTGLNSDDGNYMYVTGRNGDSGTRVTADADTSYTGSPQYWGFNGSSTTWSLMNTVLTAPVDGIQFGFGYSSGGNEASALTNLNALVPAIGYEGLNDALTVAGSASIGVPIPNGGSGCSIIAYNGKLPFANYTPGVTTAVPAQPDFTPIIKGQYSFWSYECLEMLSTHTSDNVYHYYTNLVTAIDNDIANAEAANGNSSVYGPVTAIRLSEMKVSRTAVGGKIAPITP